MSVIKFALKIFRFKITKGYIEYTYSLNISKAFILVDKEIINNNKFICK